MAILKQHTPSLVKRGFSATRLYMFGFNGKEKDDELYNSTGTSYDYGFRIYNPRIARFLSVDPLTKDYPFYTPYQFAGNKPIVNIDLDGLEDYNYLNELLKKGTEFVIQKMWDIASDAIYNATITLLKDAKAYAVKKINETSYVQDISVSPSKKVISVGAAEVNVVITGGVSWIQNIGNNKEKEGVYPHIGIGFSIGAGSAESFDLPAINYSIGIVGGNFEKAKDYTGFFADYSGTIVGIGGAYCYWPEGANAKSVIFNLTELASSIATETPNASASARFDWYFMIPDENEPSTSWENQFKNLKNQLKEIFKGNDEQFNQVIEDVEDVFNRVIQEYESTDD